MHIEPDAPTPPYRQLAEQLAARIKAGEWQPDRPIPSEMQLHEATGLARTTIRRAIEVLVADGLVYVVPRRGVYVSRTPR